MSYVVICFVSLSVAALTLFSGFGLGTLLMPAFAFYFPVEIAVAATAVVHLANNLFKVFLVGRMANLKVVLWFALPAAIAAFFGAWLLDRIADVPAIGQYMWNGTIYFVEPVKLALAALIVFFALFELVPKLRNLAFPAKYIPLGGIISGFFGGLSGHQGALRSAFLLRAGLAKEEFIGTSTVSSVVIDISRLIVYGSTFFLGNWSLLKTQGAIGLIAAGSMAALLGSLVGVRLIEKVTLETVHIIVSFLLFVVAGGLAVGWI